MQTPPKDYDDEEEFGLVECEFECAQRCKHYDVRVELFYITYDYTYSYAGCVRM